MEQFLRQVKKLIPRRLFAALQPVYHFFLALFAGIAFGFPGRRLTVIGVTGTKGKTTVVEFVHGILEETGAGVASLSSLRFKIRDREVLNDRKMTIPGRFFVQKFLRDAVRSKCRFAVIEVTSEGIKQFRHRFIGFDVVLVTNVQREHLEAHGGFEEYLRTKLDLFWRLSRDATAIINRDDASADRFVAATRAHCMFYGMKEIATGQEHIPIHDLVVGENGIEFEIKGRAITSSLRGSFNVGNIIAAVAIGVSQHIALETIAAAIARVRGIPGRLEFVQEQPFRIVVDYAHTPDSLRAVYETLKSDGKLLCVLGATGGGRDKWKRPEFGSIAAEYCHHIFFTNEDPYDEDPQGIIEEVRAGAGVRKDDVRVVLDRRVAIREALAAAHSGDTIVITGKGAEPWMMGPDGSKIAWDDREIAREEMKILK